jgi:hypothetical protein
MNDDRGGSIGPGARRLLDRASSLADVADRLANGQSSFGRDLVPGFVPEVGLTVAYGPSGSAKSFFGIDLAVTVSGGLPWASRPIDRAAIVYLASEDRLGVEARAVAAARHLQLELEGLPFSIVSPPPIHQKNFATDLAAACREISAPYGKRVGLILLDTLGAAFGGHSQDEASAMTEAADALLSLAHELRTAVVAIHHSGKDPERGMRGSAVLKDRADATIRFRKTGAGRFQGKVEKMRNAAEGSTVSFELAQTDLKVGDITRTTCVVRNLAFQTDEPAPPQPQEQVRALGGRLPKDARTGLQVLRSMTTGGEPIAIEDWRNGLFQAFGDRSAGAKRQAFTEVKRKLAGLIVIDGENVSLARSASETSE